MAINKNFVVKNGLEVNTSLLVADTDTNRVGVATTAPSATLHVNGGIGATTLNVTGVTTTKTLIVSAGATFNTQSAPVLIGVGNSTNTPLQDLQVGSSTTEKGAYISGDTGIGVTLPGARLNVVPGSTSIAGLFSGTTSADMVRITQLGSGNALRVEDSANPDATPVVITGVGSVGIGTGTPDFLLTVDSLTGSGTTAVFIRGDVRITGDLQADDLSFDELNITGVATFTNTTENTLGNPDTGAVQIDGGLGVNKNATVGAGLSVVGGAIVQGITTAANTAENTLGQSNTGSLQVFGGLGVAKNTTIGAGLSVAGGTIVQGITTAANTTENTLGNAATGALQVRGGLGVSKNATIGAGLSVGGGLLVTGLSTFVGVGTFLGNMFVGGSLGISSNFIVNSNLNILGIATVGTLVVTGISTFGGIGTFTNTAENTLGNAGTGGLQVLGGLGVAKNTTIGAGLSVVGGAIVQGITTLTTLTATTSVTTPLANVNTGIITTLRGTNLSYTGINTLGITTITDLTVQTINSSGIITGSSFRPSTGFYQSANGTNAFFVFDTTGNVAFQGTIGASQVNSASGQKVVGLGISAASFVHNVTVAGVTTSSGGFVGDLTGIAATATKLQTPRTFEITGDVVASAISFDGTGNVSLAATIQPNSVGLGTDTTGDYVRDITGTSNQITVTSGTGESSTPTLSIPSQFTAPQDVTVTRDLLVGRNLNVTGNVTIGGTSATIFTSELKVADPDIVTGVRTDALGNDIANDNTANHGGIAVASTEGNPLVILTNPAIGESTLSTYKKIMWFKSGSFTGLGTDAWLINYAVGIGSTQFPTGTRLAAGSVQFTQNDLAVVRNVNASGVVTALSAIVGSAVTINSSGVNVTGGLTATSALVGSAVTINATGVNVTGVVTATRFVGDGSQLTNTGAALTSTGGVLRVLSTNLTTGIVTSAVVDSGLLFDTNSDVLNITGGLNVSSGVSTISSAIVGSNVTLNSTGVNVTGVVTASGGFNIGIQSGTAGNVTTGVITAINFVGLGNSITYKNNDPTTKTIEVSISGSVGGGGTWRTYNAGIATAKSVGINTTDLDDPDLVGVGNSFQGLYIGNGMVIVDNALNGNHYIGTNFNGLMAGPITVNGTVTVDGNWVVV